MRNAANISDNTEVVSILKNPSYKRKILVHKIVAKTVLWKNFKKLKYFTMAEISGHGSIGENKNKEVAISLQRSATKLIIQ